ncbi:MAG: SufE family protein [Candidatus Sericytochromatia bacterium]
MESIEEIQNEIIEEFEDFSDWEEKYSYLIEQGSELKNLDEKYKIPENIVKGCQSQVWLIHKYNSDLKLMEFEADSDSLIVKGLISILMRLYSNQKPSDILNNELFVFEKIGLKGHLSPSRANGLSSMIRYIKEYSSKYI